MYFNHKNDWFVLLPSVTFSEERLKAIEAKCGVQRTPHSFYLLFDLHKWASSSNSTHWKFKMLSHTSNTLACLLSAGSWLNTVAMLCCAIIMIFVSLNKMGLEVALHIEQMLQTLKYWSKWHTLTRDTYQALRACKTVQCKQIGAYVCSSVFSLVYRQI